MTDRTQMPQIQLIEDDTALIMDSTTRIMTICVICVPFFPHA